MPLSATQWRMCDHRFDFPRPTLVMGILNVTPDSFSDGGRFPTPDSAVDAALEFVEQGADLIDIGGESTRPGAEEVSVEEECRRVIPVIEALKRQSPIPISVDTMKPAVARRALDAGAVLVNDVAANRSDPAMWNLVAERKAGYVAMHMLGTPGTMQIAPDYADVCEDVAGFFRERLEWLAEVGIDSNQIVLDVGIGFGKRLPHNLKLLSGLDRFKTLGRPLLLGVSRKSFIGEITGVSDPQLRDAGSLACAALAVSAGVNILRVHNVEHTCQAVRVAEAILTA